MCLFKIQQQVENIPTIAGPPPLTVCPLTENTLPHELVGGEGLLLVGGDDGGVWGQGWGLSSVRV